jgi:glucoamylase
MPLVWAHAEHIKLLRSLREGRVFDLPPQAYQRYVLEGVRSRYALWRPNLKCRQLPVGKILRIALPEPAIVHWSRDDWRTVEDTPGQQTAFGTCHADLDTARLAPGDEVVFTIYWNQSGRWQGEDYRLIAA